VIAGIRAAHIRIIFRLPPHLGSFADPLVYLHWFRRFRPPEALTGLHVISPSTDNRCRSSEIISANAIMRGCHLIPRFGDSQVDPSSGPDHAVDDYLEFYLNSYIDLYMFHELIQDNRY